MEAWLDTIRNLNLKDYVSYNVSEGDLAQYGLDAPMVSVSVESMVIEEKEELTENFALHIGRDPKEQQTEKSDVDGDEEVTAYARVGESGIIYQIFSESAAFF